MKKDILFKIVIAVVVLYLIQFVIAPRIWPQYYPSSNEATGILFGLITVCSFLEIVFISSKMQYLFLGDMLYVVLMLLYTNHGAYGIGMVGIGLDGNTVRYEYSASFLFLAVILAVTLCIQFLLWCIFKLFHKIFG
mgnify:CR=1 FL=1